MPRTRTADEYRLWLNPSSGIWYIVTGSGGNSKRLSTRTRDRDTAEQYRAQYLAGIRNAPPPPSALVAGLLERYAAEHGSRTRSLQTIRHHIKQLAPFFGKLAPEHISNRTLLDYAKARHGKGIKDGTVLRELGTLKAALRFAAGNRWIAPIPPLQSPVSTPPPRDLWLTRPQVARLLEAAKSHHIRLYTLIALSTAARMGAILGLTWGQVDMERGLIDFGRGWGNKRRAIVPINDDLRAALQDALILRQSDYVIEWCGKPVASIKKAFGRLADDCGIECSPHVLRHTAATWLVMDGVPLAEVARLLGTTERMVERVYGKHAPDYLRRAVGVLRI